MAMSMGRLMEVNGISTFDMVDFKKEDQIKEVTDPSDDFAKWDLRDRVQRTQEAEQFMDHVKTVHQNTQFIIQTKQDSHLPFLELTHLKPSRCNTMKR